jgi:hypothetical protein
VLGVSRSGYSDWFGRPASIREQRNTELVKIIKEIHEESCQSCGSPRVHAELTLGRGEQVSRDRGKRGSKIHLLTDRAGLPLSVGISAAKTHDKLALEPLVRGIAPIRSRRGPRRRRPAKLHGDKGHDYADLRRWLRERGITPRFADAASSPQTGSAATSGSWNEPCPG